MLRVGLTGSIAVGKTHVVGLLKELGCHVIDADQTARDVVMPGTEGLKRVVAEFGAEVLQPDGHLDRARLGSIIFGDKEKRERLNSILHPLIIKEQDDAMRAFEREDPEGIAIVDAALMIESGGYKRFDKLVVVHCRPEIQVERLMRRNSLSREEAELRIAAQMSQEEKMRHADFLIDTSDDYEATRERTEEVFQKLRELSRKRA
ncbi:MAG TPA: dephospho-CoA kinase [Pyrinomonadaceae bacterium]|nr:dephospho-CoA kinase [Pyrinomonadaceae bacterium]